MHDKIIKGRFPANLLVCDDVLNDGIERETSYRQNECVRTINNATTYPELKMNLGVEGLRGYNDSGSFSRYFDLDQWFDEIIKDLPEIVITMKDKIINGNSLDVLKDMDENSVDLIATDPPYGLKFMGKDWDKALPDIEIFKECLRVLKPGGFAFVMSAPRSDLQARMTILLEDAGFNVAFTPIYWTYASGFPKAGNLSKMADKRNERNPEYKIKPEYITFAKFIKDVRIKKGLNQKDIAKYFPSKTGGLTGCVWNWENAKNVPTLKQWIILKDVLNLDSSFDWLIEKETKRYGDNKKFIEAEREIIGKKKWNNSVNHFIPNEDHTKRVQLNDTKSATDQAKALDGAYSGFQPKPAVEPVIVAMKPLTEKTYIDQALRSLEDGGCGLGGTWLDHCRIPYKSEDDTKSAKVRRPNRTDFNGNSESHDYSPNNDGRFPADLLCSDDILNDGIKTGAGITGSGTARRTKSQGKQIFSDKDKPLQPDLGYGDSGSFSRYFDLDAWFSKRVDELPESVKKTFPFLIVPKASKSEKNRGCEGLDNLTYNDISRNDKEAIGCNNPRNRSGTPKKGNHHPTVKPVKLFSYLITLGSQPNDTILDPFSGSGTTCIASKMLGRSYIGIELEEDYITIADARLKAVEKPQPTLI